MKAVIDRVWPEIRPYKAQFIFYIFILGLVMGALKSVGPEITRLMQVAWEQGDRKTAFWLPVALGVTWGAANILRYFHLYWVKFITEKVIARWRERLMQKYLHLNLGFLHSQDSGSGGLMSRMLSDLNVVQQGLQKMADVIREPFIAILTFAYLLFIDWTLVLFILATLPVVVIIIRSLTKSLRKYSHQNMETMESMTKTLKEGLDGTRIVQSFNLQDEMDRRFQRETNNYLDTKKKIISREELAGPISETLGAVTLTLILIYVGHQIFSNKLTVGDFLAFSFAIALLQDAVKKIQRGLVQLQQTAVAIERMNHILDSHDVVASPENPKAFPVNWQSINYENVEFSYGEKPVLKDVSLTIKRGEVIAIVGASGGGKSTFVNLLLRFFEPTKGQVKIDGINIADMNVEELRKNIALVSQDVFLFGDTIERNIHSGDFDAPKEKIYEAARLANAESFILKTQDGYNTKVGERGSMLSGGEKQRVSIARAILKDAPILILDEATSALDSASEAEVQKGLEALLKDRTAFVIAHRLSTISKADRILVLKDGQICEQGSHRELLDMQGDYFRLVQMQNT